MMAQENGEVVPRFHRQVTTMASRIRDFNQMIYSPTLYGSKIDEDLQEFIAEVYVYRVVHKGEGRVIHL